MGKATNNSTLRGSFAGVITTKFTVSHWLADFKVVFGFFCSVINAFPKFHGFLLSLMLS